MPPKVMCEEFKILKMEIMEYTQKNSSSCLKASSLLNIMIKAVIWFYYFFHEGSSSLYQSQVNIEYSFSKVKTSFDIRSIFPNCQRIKSWSQVLKVCQENCP